MSGCASPGAGPTVPSVVQLYLERAEGVMAARQGLVEWGPEVEETERYCGELWQQMERWQRQLCERLFREHFGGRG